jgi:hypothetical protein
MQVAGYHQVRAMTMTDAFWFAGKWRLAWPGLLTLSAPYEQLIILSLTYHPHITSLESVGPSEPANLFRVIAVWA